MTDRFVGPGGSDAANGLSYATRRLTLNGIEDSPVVAGDRVFVAPGTYRELLTIDVSGSSGSPITYIADTTGANTDGVGGKVRVTGSDNDQTDARASCITSVGSAAGTFRTFRGFHFDTASSILINVGGGFAEGWVVEDCVFSMGGSHALSFNPTPLNNTVRRCKFYGTGNNGNALVLIENATAYDNSGNVIESCEFEGGNSRNIVSTRVGGVTIKNCNFRGGNVGVRVLAALTVGQTIVVNNCIFVACTTAFVGTVTGEIVEDYNALYRNNADRTNTATGTNSVAYPPLFERMILRNNGRQEPHLADSLMAASQLRNRTGSSQASTDLYGTAKPQETIADWGAVESPGLISRNDNAGDSEVKIDGRGYADIEIPVDDNVAITITVKCRWDNDAQIGSKPSAVLLADYGVTEQTATAVGSGTEETLTIGPVTPQVPSDIGGAMVLRLKNNSTHTSAIGCYYDEWAVA